MKKEKAAVFASGTGSNFQAMLENEDLAEDIVLLVCDQPGAAVIQKAKKLQVPVLELDMRQFSTKKAYEKRIIEKLQSHGVTWIFLAGYMRIVGSELLAAFPEKIVNIHPSLLPAFPGKDAISDAYWAGATETGVTVHYVDEGIDTGPIIKQEGLPVFAEDTLETLSARVHKAEHQLYPKVMRQLLQSRGEIT